MSESQPPLPYPSEEDRILLGPTKFRGVPDKGKAKVSNDSLTTPPRGLWSPGSTPSPLKEINDFFGNAPSESIMGGISMPSPFRFGYADPSQAESQDQADVELGGAKGEASERKGQTWSQMFPEVRDRQPGIEYESLVPLREPDSQDSQYHSIKYGYCQSIMDAIGRNDSQLASSFTRMSDSPPHTPTQLESIDFVASQVEGEEELQGPSMEFIKQEPESPKLIWPDNKRPSKDPETPRVALGKRTGSMAEEGSPPSPQGRREKLRRMFSADLKQIDLERKMRTDIHDESMDSVRRMRDLEQRKKDLVTFSHSKYKDL